MNTKIITILVVIILLGLGVYFVTQGTSDKTNLPLVNNSSITDSNDVMDTEDPGMENSNIGSKYVEYSGGPLSDYSGARRVLYFYANWCPICRPADTDFKNNSSRLPSDVTVIRVNYNDDETDASEEELANKYGITYQHTFVQIDEQGQEVTKWNGGQLDELLENII